jgi:hypothetical protein
MPAFRREPVQQLGGLTLLIQAARRASSPPVREENDDSLNHWLPWFSITYQRPCTLPMDSSQHHNATPPNTLVERNRTCLETSSSSELNKEQLAKPFFHLPARPADSHCFSWAPLVLPCAARSIPGCMFRYPDIVSPQDNPSNSTIYMLTRRAARCLVMDSPHTHDPSTSTTYMLTRIDAPR